MTTREEYIASRRPSLLDEAVENDCFTTRRDAAHALFNATDGKINFNRAVYVRMAYLQGVFTEFPQESK